MLNTMFPKTRSDLVNNRDVNINQNDRNELFSCHNESAQRERESRGTDDEEEQSSGRTPALLQTCVHLHQIIISSAQTVMSTLATPSSCELTAARGAPPERSLTGGLWDACSQITASVRQCVMDARRSRTIRLLNCLFLSVP